MVNALEPGDEAIVCVNGAFSERMAIIASRIPGVTIHRVEAPLGRTVDPDDVRRAGKGRKIKFVGVCQGETSTGVLTRVDPFRKVADELGALLVRGCGRQPRRGAARRGCASGSTSASAARRRPSALLRAWRRSPSAPARNR